MEIGVLAGEWRLDDSGWQVGWSVIGRMAMRMIVTGIRFLAGRRLDGWQDDSGTGRKFTSKENFA